MSSENSFVGGTGVVDVGKSSFPTEGILPKEETGATAFIAKNPAWDGRGIKVAIFDTGVDPGAAGLQVTSDGKRKIVDVVDCTGSGDVDTSEVKELNGTTTIRGLSGRTLKLGAWAEGLKEVRLGIKRGYELFPLGLTKRVKAERKEKFMESQKAAVAEAQQRITQWDVANKSPNEEKKREKKDLEAMLDTLKEAAEQYADAGPVFDCVVFNDGAKWRAVLDTDGSGDLTNSTPLTNYRDEQQFLTIKTVPGCKEVSLLLNYCVTIFEEGRRLSIVCDAGAHGTHVAGIVAANFPDNPELNGVAPGAQIVSCKIGDSRLGSMETGVGLVRALIAAHANGCQLINMSYGENCMHAAGGRFSELASEYVERFGIVFCASAGNNGPCLSSVGAPGGTCSRLISVGAFVSPGMMEVEYSLREALPGTAYTWSSRGPAPDGHVGVHVVAPGGAIAPVPAWTLQGKQLMNGTSMSSPNCCGGLALLLSALVASSVPYTPAAVRRAIQNTAAPVPGVEPWALGAGLLQLVGAHALLVQYAEAGARAATLDIDLSIPARNRARGLYLREAAQTEGVTHATVLAEPQFHRDCSNQDKLHFEVQVALHSTAPWCVCPRWMLLNALGKSFDIAVDPSSIAVGEAASCEVLGLDAARPELGPLFRFPITVVKPAPVLPGHFSLTLPQRCYAPGAMERRFLAVPEGATWVEVACTTQAVEGAHMLLLHALQVLPSTPTTGRNPTEIKRYLRLKPFETVREKVPVVGGVTLELCVCKWWASLGTVTLDLHVVFHGLPASSHNLFIGSHQPAELEVVAPLRAEELKVCGKLSRLRQALLPTKHSFRQNMDPRDTLPGGRYIYELELSYAFEQSEKELVKVSPRPPMHSLLYDSPLEAQLWLVLDANKQVMGAGDALYEYPLSLPKGKYTIQVLLRHDSKAMLDKLTKMILPVDFALAKELSVPVHTSLPDALTGATCFGGRAMRRGSRLRLFVSPPADKAPGSSHGDVLLGTLRVGCGEEWKRGAREDVAVEVLVAKEAKAEEDKADDKDKSEAEAEAEAVREARVKRLKGLREEQKWEAFDALAASLLPDFPDHLPLLSELLARRDRDAEAGESGEARQARCAAAMASAEAVCKAADPAALAAHFGRKHDPEEPGAKAVAKEMGERKKALAGAALARAERFVELLAPPTPAAPLAGVLAAGVDSEAQLEALWGAAAAWFDDKDAPHDHKLRYARVHSQVRRQQGRPGAAGLGLLKAMKSREGAGSKALLSEFEALCDEAGWDHWTRYCRDLALKLFPPKMPLI